VSDHQPSITDDKVLDEWRIPFGDWYDQSVDWIDVNFDGALKATEEFFDKFIDFVNETVLLGVPWYVVIIAFFFIGWIVQNIRIGVFSAVALTVCGLMGPNYWPQTARTIGYITVAVVLCCVIGIPIGVLSGRIDAFWKAVRPMLDAMQVVHSFIYMLPFIYFFGIGPVSATIVTMVFAIPPVIRLTNLGIRQVPEDVVEASRAFGQTELRILRDVQLPLARPAIMTGINQTLLMSISMLGIAALMGAGGLARFMFQALNNQDPALSGSAGLSFFLVAVVLDRLTQREGEATQSLWFRMRRAWNLRAEPEALLAEVEETSAPQPAAEPDDEEIYEALSDRERTGVLVLVAGSVITLASLLLTWNSGGGWFTSFVRRRDELGDALATTSRVGGDISDSSFNGVSATGGSWFGYVFVALAVLALMSAAAMWRNPGRTSRWLNPDGALMYALASLVMAVVYLLSDISPLGVADRGIGPIVALIGALAMTAGAVIWSLAARQEPLRPLSEYRVSAPIVASSIALAILVIGGFSAWVFDERAEAIISPELQERLDALIEEARDPDTPTDQMVAATAEMTAIQAQAQASERISIDGLADKGPGSSVWLIIVGALGLGTTAVAAGALGPDTRRQWLAGAATMGLGAGIFVFALGWIATLVRGTDPNIVSGVGSFLTMVAGAIITNSGRSVINDFRRARVYPELPLPESSSSGDDTARGDSDLIGVTGS